MILLIAGTNRPNSTTEKLTRYYAKRLEQKGMATHVLALTDLPPDVAVSALYGQSHPTVEAMQQLLDSVQQVVIVAPEYNGSIPGILKLFIDALRYPNSFIRKTVALVGLSAGVQGNASGLSHLTDILHYLRANVIGLRVQLGQIGTYFDGETISSSIYEQMLEQQMQELIRFSDR